MLNVLHNLIYRISTLDICRCFPTLPANSFLITSVYTKYDYVVASFICRYQDIFIVELPEGCPTTWGFQYLSFSCFVPPRLEPLNFLFNKDFYHAHPPIEHALVYSFPRSPCISTVVYSLRAQLQTKSPVDTVLLFEIF